MHPHQIEQLVGQHTRELRSQAQRARLHAARPAARTPARHRAGWTSARHRAGWTLVEIGLRLAGPSRHA
jgi:hypothetical protein